MAMTDRAVAPAVFAGIDVSKAALDVALRPSSEHWRSANDETGIAELVKQLRTRAPELIQS
jgi:hypothetical protein